jgi:cytochrome c peroxidase
MLFTVITINLLFASSLITPIPTDIKLDTHKVNLGKKLFFDKKLSKDSTISCAHCHDLDNGGVDSNNRLSFGVDGQLGIFNAPTVYNAIFNFRQMWDGRAKSLEEQAKLSITNPSEMGNSMEGVVRYLNTIPEYSKLFKQIYHTKINPDNILNAIAEFEKSLTTPNSPFDKYLKGDKNAITQKEKKGYDLFISRGCIICHQGVNIGGNSYNKFGIFEDSVDNTLVPLSTNTRLLKVPSLRNIAMTAPYMSNGKIETLQEAIKIMLQYQLGIEADSLEVDYILAFLKSLNGEIHSVK